MMGKRNIPDNLDDISDVKESYNALPYSSYSYSKSNPMHLSTIAKLVGMEPPPLKNAKVLELGCASGGNIIPFAMQYPESNIIGVDLSDVQINKGIDFTKHLNIPNVDLLACSIGDIDESFGKFDYIIAHGLYSWVNEPLKQKILSICNHNLNENGIAYVSYNTLPGWNNLMTIRDMALYHSQNFKAIDEKIDQTKSLLSFISDAIKDNDSFYSKLIMQSVNLLTNKPNDYIAHEFLESENTPCYFSEFIEKVKANNLRYVSDTNIASMFLDNYSEKISAKLKEINEVERIEQYLDFIVNRTFRSSILCHKSQKLDRSLDIKLAPHFRYKMDITKNENKDANDQTSFTFLNNPDETIASDNPIMISLLSQLAKKYTFVLFDDLLNILAAEYDTLSRGEIKIQISQALIGFILKGKIHIRYEEDGFNSPEINKPKAWEYAVQQCIDLNQNIVTNIFFETVQLTLFEFYLIRYINGENTREDILKSMVKHFKNGDLETKYGGKKVTSEEKLLSIISLTYIDAIERLERQALLV
jgi:methyltransferase-like protein/2-polyprenyl-3-methyl-5-hydroxy-6-metoxy-1,4-benzoquinol methylase